MLVADEKQQETVTSLVQHRVDSKLLLGLIVYIGSQREDLGRVVSITYNYAGEAILCVRTMPAGQIKLCRLHNIEVVVSEWS